MRSIQVASPRAHRTFRAKHSSLDLWRLQDYEYDLLRDYSFPIREDGYLLYQLMMADRREGREPLMLAKVLVALEEDYGPCSTSIDSHKQTFAFRFLANFSKNGQTWPYLLTICDIRGSLEFRFCRVIDSAQYADVDYRAYREPIEDEIGADGMTYWISYLWGVLQVTSKMSCKFKVHLGELKPFFRHIDSNHIIYGFIGGKFVEYEIDSPKKYEAKVAQLYRKIGKIDDTPEQQLELTRALVEAICSAPAISDP
jgi:hypothetical protein